MDSKIRITDASGKVHELECNATGIFPCVLSNTTKGDRNYTLKLTWRYDEKERKKIHDKPSGMVLQ
jgi:hypothetical protein